jgi:transposase
MTAAVLQIQNDQLQQQVATLQQALADARSEITLLRQKLDALARRFFGKKSEQLDAAQLQLLLSGLAPSQSQPLPQPSLLPVVRAPRQPRPHSQRLRTPENLEVVREVIEPEIVQAEPQKWKCISQEVSRLLDYQPGKFFWRETVRPKYVRLADRALAPVVAPAPVRVSEGCLAAPGLLAHLLVSKYADHLPFYRLQMMFWQRQGVFIARQQMVLWTGQCVALLEAIVICIKKEVRQSPYVQVDETPVRYLDPAQAGRCGQGYLWTALVPGQCVLYDWHASRAAACLETLLGTEFQGKVQCDGYSAYPAFAKDKAGVELIGCLAHARRGFFEAQEQAPQVAGWILNQIGILYRWEEQWRQSRAGPDGREALRASHSRMVMERLRRALDKLAPRYLPKSPMGQALGYALNQWPLLQRFLEHGEVEIDNNLVENAIRPTAVGKKGWLFFGSEEAGARNAVVFTLVQNCRMHGLDPYEYFKDLLERLPRMTNQDRLDQLTPRNWMQAREKTLRPAA